MAIIVDTYSVCTFEMNEVKRVSRGNPAAIWLWTYYNALKGVKLVGRETEEDKGLPHEQKIPLAGLPEAVSARFLETEVQMKNLLDYANTEMERLRQERLVAQGLADSQTLAVKDKP